MKYVLAILDILAIEKEAFNFKNALLVYLDIGISTILPRVNIIRRHFEDVEGTEMLNFLGANTQKKKKKKKKKTVNILNKELESIF